MASHGSDEAQHGSPAAGRGVRLVPVMSEPGHSGLRAVSALWWPAAMCVLTVCPLPRPGGARHARPSLWPREGPSPSSTAALGPRSQRPRWCCPKLWVPGAQSRRAVDAPGMWGGGYCSPARSGCSGSRAVATADWTGEGVRPGLPGVPGGEAILLGPGADGALLSLRSPSTASLEAA